MKRVLLEIEDEKVHQDMKVICAKKGLSIKGFIVDLIAKEIEKNKILVK